MVMAGVDKMRGCLFAMFLSAFAFVVWNDISFGIFFVANVFFPGVDQLIVHLIDFFG